MFYINSADRRSSYQKYIKMRYPKLLQAPSPDQTELYDKITKIENKIIEKVNHLKKNKKYFQCKHFQTVPKQCEEFQPTVNYYDKFWKTFLMNEICHQRISSMRDYLETYQHETQQVNELFEKRLSLIGPRSKKKTRRTAEEIEKRFSCPYNKCYKDYGSEVSLNLHIKLKHNGGNKSDRENIAQQYWQAKERGQTPNHIYINLPPNYLQQYGKLTGRITEEVEAAEK